MPGENDAVPVTTNPAGFKSLDRLLNVAGAIAAVVASVWGVWIKIEVDKQNLQVEALKAEISKSAEERESRKADVEITMKVFDALTDVYKTDKQSPEIVVNRLSAVSALIVVVPDEAIRNNLSKAIELALNVQKSSGDVKTVQQTSIIKASLDAAIFDAAESKETVPAAPISNAQIHAVAEKGSDDKPKWGALNYNLFWCEGVQNPDATRRSAEYAQTLKSLDDQANGEWRVRKLPGSVNDRPGYQIHTNLIRTSSNEETKIANLLVSKLAEHGLPGFSVQQVNYPSPASISVFFCSGASPTLSSGAAPKS